MSLEKKPPHLRPAGENPSEVPEQVIRKLSELLKSTDLAEIEISTEKMTVRVKAKEGPSVQFIGSSSLAGPAPVTVSPTSAKKTSEVAAQSDLHIIRSPFIGTFYRSSSPSNPPFIEPGQTIAKGQVLCIVEAMKLMNEIEADTSGVIEKVFVENATPVEFNTPLFGIRK